MADQTNVPFPTFGPNGFIAPLEADIQAGTMADIIAAFTKGGLNLNPSQATPQGQVANSEAAWIGHQNDLFLFFVNMVDPALSQGRMQDGIGRIYFIERIPSSPTVAQCVCIGNNVTIPVGALATSQDGYTWVCMEEGTIGLDGGSITLPFANTVYGAIPCNAENIDQIFQGISGWDTISNPAAGVTGQNVESPQQFEQRRYASVAQNSRGWTDAVLGAVYQVPGVIDAFVFSNSASISQIYRGYVMLPNSIYVAVIGGEPQAVAEAIWRAKGPGSLYNGNTTLTVLDENPLYTPPYPDYQVTYEIPDNLPFVVNVTMANNGLQPTNATTLVQNAVVATFAGLDGGPRARIGSTVYASRLYANLAALWPGATVVEILLGTANDSTAANFVGSIAGTALTVIDPGVGTISAGMSLFDSNGTVTPGTTIVSGSGTAWQVSTPQTVASVNMQGVLAGSFSEAVHMDQVPVVSTANVNLTFV